MNRDEGAKASNDDILRLGAFVGAVGTLLMVLKYLPVIFLGGIFGALLWIGTLSGPINKRLLRPTFGLFSLAICLFVLVGVPTAHPSRFTGLYGLDGRLHDLARAMVGEWNHLWPIQMKGMWVRSLSALDVTRYAWLTFVSALGTMAVLLGGMMFFRKTWIPPQALVRASEALAWPWLRFLQRIERRGSPLDKGFEVGSDENGNPFHLSERNLGYHVQMIAPTGSGKTNLLKHLLQNRIRLGHGVIFLDYKGDSDLFEWALSTTHECSRADDFRLISLSEPEVSVPYNPLVSSDAIALHSQIMNSLTWSEEFYRKVASITLLTILKGLVEYKSKTNCTFHLGTIVEMLDDATKLQDFASLLHGVGASSSSEVAKLAVDLDRPSSREKILGLVASLGLIRASSAGKLMSQDVERGSFGLREALDQNRIAFFVINSLKLKESAAALGRLILQDLMQQIADRYERRGERNPVTVIIDEFASFAIPEFIEVLDRARGAGVGFVIAHQSRADLEEISPNFKERVEANMNTTILSGLNSPDDAEHFAGMLGTRATTAETVQKEREFGLYDHETGLRSTRSVEEFVVHPNRLKALSQGEVFVLARTVDPRWGFVRVPLAPCPSVSLNRSKILTDLGATRAGYQRGPGAPLKFDAARSTDDSPKEAELFS